MSASRSGAVLLSAYPYLKIRLACQRCTRRIQ
jgi:hypothetical protein